MMMLKFIAFLIGLHHIFTFSNCEVISTTTGDISGTTVKVLGQDVDEYLGIPYAKPPLGELRFKPPVPVEAWNGVLNATKQPLPCMQFRYLRTSHTHCSEDCLFINIWVPKNGTDVVMVYFHGGGFTFGSIGKDEADGSAMSRLGGVIFASVSYRLGPFGFLNSETDDARGNMGMKDQVLGLQWINNNIRAFGGDPSKITIFGHSAGAISVSTHLISPLTKGLFKSAIMQSGSSYNPFFPVRHSRIIKLRSEILAEEVGCTNEGEDISTDPNVMSCLRNASAYSILLAEAVIMVGTLNSKFNPALSFFTPIYGDDYLPNSPIQEIDAGNIHVKSFMIGTTKDEGSLFLSTFADQLLTQFDDPETTEWRAASYIGILFRQLTSDIVTDYYLKNTSFPGSSLLKRAYDSIGDYAFDCPSVFLSESAARNGKNVYYYIFNQNVKKYQKWMGVSHGQEMPFLFPTRFNNPSLNKTGEREFSKELIGIWTSFAKEDKPFYSRLSGEWPLYNNQCRLAVELNAYNVSYRNPYKDSCQFWKMYFDEFKHVFPYFLEKFYN